jgi:hypothetical protein
MTHDTIHFPVFADVSRQLIDWLRAFLDDTTHYARGVQSAIIQHPVLAPYAPRQ